MKILSTRYSFVLIALLGMALTQAGCGSLSKPYPEKSLHALNIGDPASDGMLPASRSVLFVDRVRVAEPFESSAFVYKIGDSQFTTDYYNGFITSPARLLTGELSNWISRSSVFTSVIAGDSVAEYQLSLETNVTALYGDYQQGKPRQAVIEARFFLIDQTSGKYNVVFNKRYRESEAIEGSNPNPDALVKAWDTAYRRMLGGLVTDLRAHPIVASAAEH
jgi:uncharacterized lipoprotein YmbA